MKKKRKVVKTKDLVIGHHFSDGYKVFRPVESISWILAEKGAIRRGIILKTDLKDVSDDEIKELTEEYCIDEILFVYSRPIRNERYFSTSARVILKNIKEFKDNKETPIADFKCPCDFLVRQTVGLHHCFNNFKVFIPYSSKFWLLAEKENKRKAIFILKDMSAAIPGLVKSIVESNEIDEVLFVVKRLLRKTREFDIDVPVTVQHEREFNLRKMDKNG